MSTPFQNDPGVQWMLAYQAGSEEAFERLVQTYSAQVYGLFSRFVGVADEREDLVQELFLRVVRARQRYQPTARFSTWLYRIAFNLAVNRSERTRNDASLEGSPAGRDAWDRPGAEDPAAGLEREDVVRAVRSSIAALPESQRMALILAKYEELSFAEIAVVMDSSEKAIKSLIHRAREKLRERLAPFLEQELT